MKIGLFHILILIVTSCFSQQKIVNIEKSYFLDTVQFIEKYSVLKANTSIKHGEYLKLKVVPRTGRTFNRNWEIVERDRKNIYIIDEKGYYKENAKDSLWIEAFGFRFHREGLYENGNKTGLWQEYYGPMKCGVGEYCNNIKSGEWSYWNLIPYDNPAHTYKTLIYNHSKDSIMYQCLAQDTLKQYNLKFRALRDSVEIFDKIRRQAIFPYGYRSLRFLFSEIWDDGFVNLDYQYSGLFLIKIEVDSDNSVEYNISLERETVENIGCQQEIKRVFGCFPDVWIASEDLNGDRILSCAYSLYKIHTSW